MGTTELNGAQADRQLLEAVKLDDEDALARIAFDAFMVATGHPDASFDRDAYKDAWRAVGAAVRAAALLAHASRAMEDV